MPHMSGATDHESDQRYDDDDGEDDTDSTDDGAGYGKSMALVFRHFFGVAQPHDAQHQTCNGGQDADANGNEDQRADKSRDSQAVGG